jgi:hypothetical protein
MHFSKKNKNKGRELTNVEASRWSSCDEDVTH